MVESVAKSGMKKVARLMMKEYMVVTGILLMSVIFTLSSPYFFTWDNWKNILLQSSTVAIVALGQAIILLTGNFDLSLGRNLCLASCVGALLMKGQGITTIVWNPWLAALVMISLAAFVGLCNGLLTAYVGLPAFIATLGTQYICYGIAKLITSATPIPQLPDAIGFLGRGYIAAIPICVIIMICLYALAQFLSIKTRVGRNLYAVGGSREAAFFTGIKVKKYYLFTFVIAGALAGIGGLVLMSRLNSVSLSNGQNYEFDAVIGSIIGGISLAGGKGKLIGTMLGVIFLVTLFNGMSQIGIDPFVQDVLKGFVLVIAITIDVLTNKKRT
jgi:ribose transport system permease protein